MTSHFQRVRQDRPCPVCHKPNWCLVAPNGSAALCARISLRIGWSVHHWAWSFPMTDAAGEVLGIRLRRPNGFKFAVRGGHEGLFVPATIRNIPNAMLFICEGPTDAAALLDMGLNHVIGRPSCNGGTKLLLDIVRDRQPREVVIVADNDGPGLRGAGYLASVLVGYVTSVRVVAPPAGFKDARQWMRAGANRHDMNEVIKTALVRRVSIRASIRR